jgi:hypothetical protein
VTSDPQSAGEPLPPWLRDASIEPDEDAAGAAAVPPPASPTAALRDLIARAPNRPAPADDAGVPIWLQNLLDAPDDASAAGDAEAAGAALPHAPAGEAAPPGERGASAPDDASAAAPAVPGATRPLERRSTGAITDLPIVEAGPVDPAILASIVTPALTGGRYTPVQVQAIERLRAITARSAAATAPEIADEPPRPSRLSVEHILSAVVLVLVIAAVSVPTLAAPFRGAPAADAAPLASSAIAALGPGDVVLLAYEWDARRTAELAPIERAMLDHLAERGVGLVLFSSDPQGVLPQLAAQDQLARTPSGGAVLALGYQPGGSAALASLARTFGPAVAAAVPAAATDGRLPLRDGMPIAAIADLSAIIIFADDPTDVQGWMEQVYPAATRAAPPVPLMLVVTADASLTAAPYARQPGVMMLAGPTAAAGYRATRGTHDDGQFAALRLITLGLGVLLAAMALTASIATAVRRRSAS